MRPSPQSYTVRQVAGFAKVSVRALHFYDEIGLLRPAYTGANGYRYYGSGELRRLQDILFYREFGFALDQIRRLLDSPGFDRLATLKSHRRQLRAQAGRIEQLIQTIDQTIMSEEGKTAMNPKKMYAGVSPKKQAEYEKYLTDRYGQCATKGIAESKQKTRGWGPADFAREKAGNDQLNREFARLLEDGVAPGDPAAQALAARHHAMVCRFWTPSPDAYVAMGRMYGGHPDFRRYYEAFHPKLVAYLSEAIRVYAERELKR